MLSMFNVIFWEIASVTRYLDEFSNFADDGGLQGTVSP
jgi:hypothetical protein